MNIQILPNWCKKLGLSVFLIFFIISGIDGFVDGYSGAKFQDENGSRLLLEYFGSTITHLFNVLSIVGMIIYMMSREKIEDDYIVKLRLESFQLTTLIILIISVGIYTFYWNLKLSLDYFIMLFIWFYLFIFFIKKRVY